jgi:hypothetical protein
MREATALVRRVELSVSGESEPVVAGFKESGNLSLYFGADPVFHFDAAGRLRRGYCQGLLYRTQGLTLARLDRRRTMAATELVRQDLNADELAEFRTLVRDRLDRLKSDLASGRATIVRQAPLDDADIAADLAEAIEVVLNTGIALAAAIRGRE